MLGFFLVLVIILFWCSFRIRKDLLIPKRGQVAETSLDRGVKCLMHNSSNLTVGLSVLDYLCFSCYLHVCVVCIFFVLLL